MYENRNPAHDTNQSIISIRAIVAVILVALKKANADIQTK
jgi:hypothetical protein